ncbi:MAG: hypothetical protein Q7R98_00035 [Candidatus Jorgensenbacteria bacterium]|nr:hypothetical protein [Candidatus Jorgensenbacteria bacterium]
MQDKKVETITDGKGSAAALKEFFVGVFEKFKEHAAIRCLILGRLTGFASLGITLRNLPPNNEHSRRLKQSITKDARYIKETIKKQNLSDCDSKFLDDLEANTILLLELSPVELGKINKFLEESYGRIKIS